VQKSLLDLAGGSTVGHVKVGDIRTLRIPVPSLDEQERIVRAYGSSEARLMSEQALSTKLQKQKSGLMDDLLTGRVRVTPLLKQEVTT
jgi:type I restriction enzyme S subunit